MKTLAYIGGSSLVEPNWLDKENQKNLDKNILPHTDPFFKNSNPFAIDYICQCEWYGVDSQMLISFSFVKLCMISYQPGSFPF